MKWLNFTPRFLTENTEGDLKVQGELKGMLCQLKLFFQKVVSSLDM